MPQRLRQQQLLQRRHGKRRYSAALLFAFSITATVAVDTARAIEEVDISSRRAELSTLQSTLQTLEQQLIEERHQRQELQDTFRQTEIAIGELAAAHHQLTQQQKQLQKELTALQKQQKTVEKRLQKQRTLIEQQLRASHKWQDHNPLQLFFQQSPEEINRQLYYLERINQARQQQIHDYRTTLAQQRAAASEIAAQKKNIAANQQQLAQQQQQLAQLQQQRQRQLQRLTETIASHQQQVEKLWDDSEALQKLLQRMQRAQRKAAKPQSFATAKGHLPWPLDGQQRFSFGQPRPGSEIPWQGVTLAAELGQPVRAIHAGHVVFADWFQGQGLLIIVDHGEGYMSLYGHNQSLLRSVGSQISRGETIATAGNSGGRQEAALYFEIRHNGAPSDPEKWCKTP